VTTAIEQGVGPFWHSSCISQNRKVFSFSSSFFPEVRGYQGFPPNHGRLLARFFSSRDAARMTVQTAELVLNLSVTLVFLSMELQLYRIGCKVDKLADTQAK
jgi:hypothetical protein